MFQHTYQGCKNPPCDDAFSEHQYCDLAFCTVCRGAEGSLTTDCPGVKVEEYDQQLVYKGLLQFKDGEWFRRPYESWEEPNPIDEFNADNAAARLSAACKKETEDGSAQTA